MTSARHRAQARARARSFLRRLGTPTALAATATTGVVAAGILGAGAVASGKDDLDLSRAGTAVSQSDLAALESREERVDRSADRTDRSERTERTLKRVTLKPQAVRHVWSTAPLNVWTEPREQGPKLRVLDSGSKIAVTGQRVGGWAEILVEGTKVRWVNAEYLANHKPRPEKATSSGGAAAVSGVSTAPCPDGSGTESGLVPNAVLLYRAVCNAFPQLTTYGGYDPHGEHADGHAIDFMISDSATGQAVADWVRANAAALHVYDVIWSQHIWTPERAAEGWRYMSDRGSPTANHYDHVHVAVY